MSSERTFRAHSRVGVKREVLRYWHRNHSNLGLSLEQFLARCRLSDDERKVTFR